MIHKNAPGRLDQGRSGAEPRCYYETVKLTVSVTSGDVPGSSTVTVAVPALTPRTMPDGETVKVAGAELR